MDGLLPTLFGDKKLPPSNKKLANFCPNLRIFQVDNFPALTAFVILFVPEILSPYFSSEQKVVPLTFQFLRGFIL